MNCPICRSKQLSIRRKDALNQGNAFMVCLGCGHNFCSLKVPDCLVAKHNSDIMFGGDEGNEMPEWFSPCYHYGERHFLWLKSMIGKFGFEKGNLLDIGCGCGDMLEFFYKNSSFTCFGNDIAHKACAILREKLDIPIYEGAFTAEIVGTQRFDVIITSHVIEHLNDPINFVREIKNVCNEGALVIVICPNDDSLTAKFKRRVIYPAGLTHEYGHIYYPMHLQGYTPASLRLLFESAGMSVEWMITLSKSQKIFGRKLKGRKEFALFPLFVMEQFMNMGSVLCAGFQV